MFSPVATLLSNRAESENGACRGGDRSNTCLYALRCCENALVRTRAITLLASSCLVLAACGGSSEPGAQPSSTTVAPTTAASVTTSLTAAGPGTDEVLEGVREALVKLLMEREGIERGAAEERANLLMERGTDPAVIEQQIAIYASWMDNYPVHPVLGRHWTEDQAECAIVTMMRVEGVARTVRLMNDARTGGMSVEDAQALVQPVAYCVDLLVMVRAEMTAMGVPQDLDCLLAGLDEADVATWYVAVFTDGPAGFNAALSEGVDLTCPTVS